MLLWHLPNGGSDAHGLTERSHTESVRLRSKEKAISSVHIAGLICCMSWVPYTFESRRRSHGNFFLWFQTHHEFSLMPGGAEGMAVVTARTCSSRTWTGGRCHLLQLFYKLMQNNMDALLVNHCEWDRWRGGREGRAECVGGQSGRPPSPCLGVDETLSVRAQDTHAHTHTHPADSSAARRTLWIWRNLIHARNTHVFSACVAGYIQPQPRATPPTTVTQRGIFCFY